MVVLRNQLFSGPLDIVADVHGEIEPLHSLLHFLGYSDSGVHPQGRRLVFVGDLTDRGPDSVSVVRFVRDLIARERAQSVLGNHDLNLLLGLRKLDNGWFYGEPFYAPNGEQIQQTLADESIREEVLEFFRTLPIGLERDDLRVIHAHWSTEMFALLPAEGDVTKLFREHSDRIKAELERLGIDNETEVDLAHQNQNPVKLLTSGPERASSNPKPRDGSVHFEERVKWWQTHRSPWTCVFGHYGTLDWDARANRSAICVDFGVGRRWKERLAGVSPPYTWRLAALRFPERLLVFDDGSERPL